MATFNFEGTTHRIEGLAELRQVLRQLPDKIQKKALDRAVRGAAKITRDEAMRLAPVRGRTTSMEVGSGASPVTIETQRRGEARFIRNQRKKGRWSALFRLPGYLRRHIAVRRVRTGPEMALFTVGPTRSAFYGMFLEFGTRKISARPFLRPAWDATKERVLENIKRRLAEAVRIEAEKLAGTYNKRLSRRR
jgi:HK97 gp10 family phage protein